MSPLFLLLHLGHQRSLVPIEKCCSWALCQSKHPGAATELGWERGQLALGMQSCHGDSLGRAARGVQAAKSRPVWTGVFLHTQCWSQRSCTPTQGRDQQRQIPLCLVKIILVYFFFLLFLIYFFLAVACAQLTAILALRKIIKRPN